MFVVCTGDLWHTGIASFSVTALNWENGAHLKPTSKILRCYFNEVQLLVQNEYTRETRLD
jgi:hypothetical protein